WYDKLFEPSKWVERKTLDLIEKLRRDRRLFLLLDDFDKLLAPDRTIADRNLRVFFELCLENAHSLRFIVASSLEINFGKEVWDQIWRKVRKIELKDGLPEGDAIAWLRELGHDVGVKALQDAPEEQLREAAQHCCYIPKELNSFAGRLASDKNLTLTALLHEAESMTDLNFGKEHFHSLDDAQRRVAGALAVYNEAVSVEAIEALLKPDFPRLDVRSSLDALRHSLAVVPVHGRGDRDSDTYQLEGRYWPYAYQQIPDGDQGYAKRSLHARAADYFLERFLSRSSPGAALDDQATLRRTELHHRLKAADYDGAARLLDEFDEDLTPIYLSIYLDAEREYHLSERILDQYLMWSYLCTLGEAHCNAGQFQEAFRCDEQSLAIARVLRDHHKELGSLIDLGGDRLGQVRTDEAIRFFKKALQIFSEGDNPSQKAIILYNLGICFAWSGETRRAIQFYKRALCTYAPEHKKQRDECLACLGRAYAAQGKANLALHYLKQAYENLQQAYEIEDRCGRLKGKGTLLHTMAEIAIDKGLFPRALRWARKGLKDGKKIDSVQLLSENYGVMARAHLHSGNLEAARKSAQDAVGYNYPPNHHENMVLLGVISLRHHHIFVVVGRIVVSHCVLC